MTSRLVPRSLIALLVFVAGLAFESRADASDTSNGAGIALSVNGADFGAGSDGPLLDVDRFSPGSSITATLGVRSSMSGSSTLHLSLEDVSDDDNGCVAAEQRVDSTCGSSQGDLGRTLRFTVSTAADRGGPYRAVWTGEAGALAHDLDTGMRLTSGGQRWVRLTADLPSSAGAAIESDSFGFGLKVSLLGANGALAVDAINSHHRAGSTSTGRHGVDAASTSSLATTGVAVLFYVVAGVLLIVAGGSALLGARRRRTQPVI